MIWLIAFSKTPFYQFLLVDARTYDEAARWILQNGWIPNTVFERAPLYTYFVAIIYTLFSADPLWVRMVQIGIGATNAVLMYYWIRNGFYENTARIAAMITASYGILIYHDTDLLNPTVGLFFLLLYLFLSTTNPSYQFKIRFLETNRLYFAAISLSFAVLTIPTLIFALPYMVFRQKWKSAKEFISSYWKLIGLTLSLPILVIVFQWIKFGEPILSLQGGVNLYIGNNPYADGYTAEVPGFGAGWTFPELKHRLEVEKKQPIKWHQLDKHYRNLSIQFWLEQPLKAIQLFLKKVGYLLFYQEISNTFDIHQFIREFRWSRPLLFVGWWCIAPLAISGFIFTILKKAHHTEHYLKPLYWTILSLSLGILLFFVNTRYRLPLVPLFIPMAAWMIEYFYKNRKSFKELVGPSILLIIACFVVWYNWNDYSDDQGSFGKMQLALAYKEQGDWARAEEKFLQAYEAQNNLPGVQYELANIALIKGDTAAARKWIMGELKSANDPRNEINIAFVLVHLNELELAKILLERALNKNPYLEQGWRNLWRVELVLAEKALLEKDTLEAVAIYKKIAQVPDPIFRQFAQMKLDSLSK
ncbi:MAG: glycosyltransferase family 39 protein [bacterium]|nr:glycosyltransferase family 39 protein [bacterium]